MQSELITILALRPFKWALICSIWTTGARYACKKVFFFGKGPGQGQIPGLLGHGLQIPDLTIDHCKATDLCSKYQLSSLESWNFEHKSVAANLLASILFRMKQKEQKMSVRLVFIWLSTSASDVGIYKTPIFKCVRKRNSKPCFSEKWLCTCIYFSWCQCNSVVKKIIYIL
jgi:hypothetical protein